MARNGSTESPNKRPPLRTGANADLIVALAAEGKPLREIARTINATRPAIQLWIKEDERKNGADGFAGRFARAKEAALEAMADELLQIADDRSFIGKPDANALVTQQRLAVDTRKWLLSKRLPRVYGDRIEVAGDNNAPIVTRIELVAVHPKLSPPTIEHDDEDRE